MFENLSDKLQRVFKNLRGEGKLTAENMEAALRDEEIPLHLCLPRPPVIDKSHRQLKRFDRFC